MSRNKLSDRVTAARALVAQLGADLAEEASGLGADELFELTGELQGIVNAAEGAQLVAAAHAASHETRLTSRGPVEVHHEVGFVDAMAPSEVALATGTTVGVAGNRVQLGADLAERFPRLLEAVVAGAVTPTAVRKVVAACEGLDARACSLVEAVLVERLPELDPARVTTVARRVAHRVAPHQAAAQAARNRRTRTVEVSPGPDGTTTWWALLPAEGSAVAWSAVRTLAQDYQRSDPSLSIDQARADAMVDLMLQRVTVTADVTLGVPVVTTPDASQCDPLAEAAAEGPETAEGGARGTAETGAVAPLDTITDHDTGELVDVADLAPGSSRELGAVASGWFSGEPGWDLATVMAPMSSGVAVSGCQIPGVGWVEAGTVAGILSTVPLVVGRALLDAATGTVLETTADTYSPSRAIRRHVQTRDGTCRMWGCTRPVEQCDLDHTRPWPAGVTTPGNLAGLCRRHHRMKQRARWRYTLAPDGTVTWMSPGGAKRVTLPDHALWPPRGPTLDPSSAKPGGASTSGACDPGRAPGPSAATPPF